MQKRSMHKVHFENIRTKIHPFVKWTRNKQTFSQLFSCLSLKLAWGGNINNRFYAEIEGVEFQTILIIKLVDLSEVLEDYPNDENVLTFT